MPAGSNTQVSNGTEKECVRSVVKSDVYLEGEASSPLHRRVGHNRLWVMRRIIRSGEGHMYGDPRARVRSCVARCTLDGALL